MLNVTEANLLKENFLYEYFIEIITILIHILSSAYEINTITAFLTLPVHFKKKPNNKQTNKYNNV